jgi:hypothetical protein
MTVTSKNMHFHGFKKHAYGLYSTGLIFSKLDGIQKEIARHFPKNLL